MTHEFYTPLDIKQIETNFADLNPPMTRAEASVEANRCLYCYDAPCTRACLTHIDVPSFIKKIASGNLIGSARVIFEANPIGATCARVCPVDVLCEGACVEKTLVQKPIEIGRLQRYATDYALENGKQIFTKGEPNGKSVGIVGSGPAGLSCAAYLARLGYDVTVYERKPKPGGLDTYGMAEYKMQQSVSLAETEHIAAMGVKFLLNTEISSASSPPYEGGVAPASGDGVVLSSSDIHDRGNTNRTTPSAKRGHPSFAKEGSSANVSNGAAQTVEFSDLETWHDAVFLATGLGQTNSLNIPGEDLNGVYDALHFIEMIKTREWKNIPLGKTIAVIGAGNTAIDAVTQAKRLGAERVILVYRRTAKEMSAYEYEYELAKKDGIEFVWRADPIGILSDAGNENVAGLQCERTDGSLKLFDIPCDMVIKATGQQKTRTFFEKVIGVDVDDKGRVVISSEMQTSNPKIFAGGDCANGGREAVDASQMGKLAAMGIHKALTGESVRFMGSL